MAGNLFQQILFAADVRTMTRRFDRPAVGRVIDSEVELFKDPIHYRMFYWSTKECLNSLFAKGGDSRPPFSGIDVDRIAKNLSACNSLNHGGCAVAGVARLFNIR